MELICDHGIHDPGNEAVEREFAQIMGELAACGNQRILCLGPKARLWSFRVAWHCLPLGPPQFGKYHSPGLRKLGSDWG